MASSAPSRVRDELLLNFERPAREPCRPSSPAEQATTADADEIGSLLLKGNYESRASDDVLRDNLFGGLSWEESPREP